MLYLLVAREPSAFTPDWLAVVSGSNQLQRRWCTKNLREIGVVVSRLPFLPVVYATCFKMCNFSSFKLAFYSFSPPPPQRVTGQCLYTGLSLPFKLSVQNSL